MYHKILPQPQEVQQTGQITSVLVQEAPEMLLKRKRFNSGLDEMDKSVQLSPRVYEKTNTYVTPVTIKSAPHSEDVIHLIQEVQKHYRRQLIDLEHKAKFRQVGK